MRKLCGLFILAFLMCGLLRAASITVTSPGTNNDWVKGQPREIKWVSSTGVPNQVRIQLRNETSTSIVLDIVNPTPNDSSYWWTVPDSLTPGKYRIRVKAIGMDVYGDSPVLTISPVRIITITQPAPQVKWARGTTHAITWTNTGPVANKVSLFLYQNGNRTTIVSCTGNDGNFSWMIPASTPAGQYQVEVMAVDPQCQIIQPHASSAFFSIINKILPGGIVEKKK